MLHSSDVLTASLDGLPQTSIISSVKENISNDDKLISVSSVFVFILELGTPWDIKDVLDNS